VKEHLGLTVDDNLRWKEREMSFIKIYKVALEFLYANINIINSTVRKNHSFPLPNFIYCVIAYFTRLDALIKLEILTKELLQQSTQVAPMNKTFELSFVDFWAQAAIQFLHLPPFPDH
jgi:hypothetical protein